MSSFAVINVDAFAVVRIFLVAGNVTMKDTGDLFKVMHLQKLHQLGLMDAEQHKVVWEGMLPEMRRKAIPTRINAAVITMGHEIVWVL